MKNHVVMIKGQPYNLPPFTAGQMRHLVDPVLRETADLMKQALSMREGTSLEPQDFLDLTLRQREAAVAQADAVLAALKNQYQHLTLDDLETLTPARIAQTFNELHQLTIQGSNEPGEVIPPIQKAKKSH